ncbi:protein of unknown function [Candidatus Nitrosocaldus cavascurensis]|jgi:hypothetical protein|uniref:Uncharacterized protein n=2 Tax=Candidatus Nitrosocaldaceae TaxID=1968910 RepID=A0A2K5AR97_9ARCH|nr:protein of unknown function [Candidatus Nitrosocaldus cavascurensis]
MNMSKQDGEGGDDAFVLYSLLESRIEMLEEHVSMLRRELASIKRMMDRLGYKE